MSSRKRGRPFQPGNQHGKGRPAGSRNKVTLECEALLEGEGPALTRKVIEMAKEGSLPALKLCLERIVPPRHEARLKLDLPDIVTADDIPVALRVVMKELAQGNLTSSQAESITGLLEFARKSIETQELAHRMEKMEAEIQEVKQAHEQRAA